MNSKLLLVKAITLLCLESQVPALAQDPSYDLCEQIADKTKKREGTVSDFGEDTVESLRSSLIDAVQSRNHDTDLLMQRIKLTIANDISTYESIERGLIVKGEGQVLIDNTHEKVSRLRTTLRKDLAHLNLIELMETATFKLRLGPEQVKDYDQILPLVKEKIEANGNTGEDQIEGHVAGFDLSKPADVAKALRATKRALSLDGIIKFSLQGFNNLFGDHQGLRRGEFCLISALQHKWKSGILRRMFIDACMYNTPFLIDKMKKPAAVFISLENDAELDILQVYKEIEENKPGGKTIDITALTDEEIDEASHKVVEDLCKNGVTPIIERFNPSYFTFDALKTFLERLERNGYEVIFMSIDYLNKMSKRGCNQGGVSGDDIKDLFTKVFNYVAAKKIATATAHQMSTEAKQMERNGVDMLVKEVKELGYYENCRSLDQIVDIEIYQHKVCHNGKYYITWQRGKHRKPTITPDEMMFCIYEFEKIGSFKPDIFGEAKFSRRLGGGTGANANQAAWDDFGMAA